MLFRTRHEDVFTSVHQGTGWKLADLEERAIWCENEARRHLALAESAERDGDDSAEELDAAISYWVAAQEYWGDYYSYAPDFDEGVL